MTLALGLNLSLDRHAKSTTGNTDRLWTPADDGALISHHDAAEPASLQISGTALTDMLDLSGNQLTLSQTIAADRPSMGTRSLNGIDVPSFDGGDWLQIETFPVPASGNFSLALLASIDEIVGDQSNVYASLASMVGGNQNWQLQAGSETEFDGFFNGDGAFADLDLTGGPFSGWNIWVLDFDFSTGALVIRVNGTQALQIDYAAKVTAQTLNLMTNRSQNSTVVGGLAEMVTSQTIDAERVEGYLAHAWNLASLLPSDHIYKSSAPRV